MLSMYESINTKETLEKNFRYLTFVKVKFLNVEKYFKAFQTNIPLELYFYLTHSFSHLYL